MESIKGHVNIYYADDKSYQSKLNNGYHIKQDCKGVRVVPAVDHLIEFADTLTPPYVPEEESNSPLPNLFYKSPIFFSVGL